VWIWLLVAVVVFIFLFKFCSWCVQQNRESELTRKYCATAQLIY
jgi:uncharacterized protein YggT (Ycf19 family)